MIDDETKKILNRAYELREEIEDLELFLMFLKKYDNNGYITKNVKMVLKVKNKRSLSVFGSYFFGCGTHEHKIKIPYKAMDFMTKYVQELIDELKAELKSLIKPKE